MLQGIVGINSDASTLSQVSNWNGVEMEIYLGHKFHRLHKGLRCESLSYDVVTLPTLTNDQMD